MRNRRPNRQGFLTLSGIVVLGLILSACGVTLTPAATPSATTTLDIATPTPTITLAPTPALTSTPLSMMPPPTPTSTPTRTPTVTYVVTPTVTPLFATPYFEIDGAPFRFIGGFVPGWHWGEEWWTEATDEDLVKTAKDSGISVLHLMLPQFERQLGTYTEFELRKLDHLLDSASRHGVYVMISFLQAYGIVLAPDDPYFHPKGIEGLLTDKEIMQGFRNRIKILVTRQNTFNGKLYRDDPTILAWLVVDEPISAPWNYPEGPPNVTITQLRDWLGETASYIKSLDPNHLVAVHTTPAIDNLGNDWIKAFDVTSLDFIEAEDADMRILNYFYPTAASDYPLKFYSLNKPVVAMLSFTSDVWDQTKICNDYAWQAEMLSQALTRHFETGTSGVVVFSWGSTLYPFLPPYDRCFNYNARNSAVVQVLREVASKWNLLDYPFMSLEFVRIKR